LWRGPQSGGASAADLPNSNGISQGLALDREFWEHSLIALEPDSRLCADINEKRYWLALVCPKYVPYSNNFAMKKKNGNGNWREMVILPYVALDIGRRPR
jgi:hypothetical protein